MFYFKTILQGTEFNENDFSGQEFSRWGAYGTGTVAEVDVSNRRLFKKQFSGKGNRSHSLIYSQSELFIL